MAERERIAVQTLVIGSGAGGAITAATLAEAGRDVLVVEEGPRADTLQAPTHSPQAMQTLYRNAGLAPILGNRSIAFVEGRCVGGSTEVNSAFWHRPPEDATERWRRDYGVRDLTGEDLKATFEELEAALGVGTTPGDALAPSSRVFGRGLEIVGAPAVETPRVQTGDVTASQFGAGAKRSMSRTYIPRAIAAGARLWSDCRVTRIEHERGRVARALASRIEAGRTRRLAIEAEEVFVCGGAIQTPALLRASGVRRNVGNSLRIQPMLKVAAVFDEVLDGHKSVMPVYQLRDPQSGVFLGGSVFSPGFLGMTLAERWPENEDALRDWRRSALYYAACRGSGAGRVRVVPFTGEAVVRYRTSREDQRNLSAGLARLCEVLFAGGARRIYPGLRGAAPLETPEAALDFRRDLIPMAQLSLSTVHVTSSCPMGENDRVCATDSFGRVAGFENLHIADASVVPDAPGVNPQGTVMALALRNARHFLSR